MLLYKIQKRFFLYIHLDSQHANMLIGWNHIPIEMSLAESCRTSSGILSHCPSERHLSISVSIREPDFRAVMMFILRLCLGAAVIYNCAAPPHLRGALLSRTDASVRCGALWEWTLWMLTCASWTAGRKNITQKEYSFKGALYLNNLIYCLSASLS